MPTPTFEPLARILPDIRLRATLLDQSGDWPADDLRQLAEIGAFRWFVPLAFDGEGIDPLELHLRYEALASASLATALLISQRDSAIALLAGSDRLEIQQELLPALARGEYFATIGIAQLTTSRQSGQPALLAVREGEHFRLNGTIPWSTGAARAKYVIAGAALASGEQILFALPTGLPGITIHPPMPLVALRASWTTSIDLKDVNLNPHLVIRGPVEKALSGRSKSIPLGQVFLAFGLCRGALDLIAEHHSDRARSLSARFEEQLATLRTEVLEICRPEREPDAARAGPALRAACNDLAVRITQSSVALYKGSALLTTHPAQRLARDAMFLLVWSCPDPVIDCTVNALSAEPPGLKFE